ncbi:galacturonan 1,4-alpha-galacturonidase [Sarracenia purpurea var. burkii]
MELSIAAISLWLLLAHGANANTFDIRNYGAQAGGRTDISQCLEGRMCVREPKQSGDSMGDVFVNQSANKWALHGSAPADPAQFRGTDSWITIQSVDRLTITGAGTFDGRGSTAWTTNDCGRNRQCAPPPVVSLNPSRRAQRL